MSNTNFEVASISISTSLDFSGINRDLPKLKKQLSAFANKGLKISPTIGNQKLDKSLQTTQKRIHSRIKKIENRPIHLGLSNKRLDNDLAKTRAKVDKTFKGIGN